MVEEDSLDNNPAIRMYRNIPKDTTEQPAKKKSGGLLARNGTKKMSGKPDPKSDVAMRVARYVNDIRNYNA